MKRYSHVTALLPYATKHRPEARLSKNKLQEGKGKGNVHPRTGHEGLEGE